jgi:thiol-disulfide isomerase/thioredoxin
MLSRNTVMIVVFALAGGVAGTLLGRWMATPPERPVPPGVDMVEVGEALPPLSLPDITGAEQAFAQWAGRPLLINFWATWCAPCVEEMPILDAFATGQGSTGVQVVGVALDDPDAVIEFLGRVSVDYPILLAGHPGIDDLSVLLGNRRSVLPYSVLVGADGRLAATAFGDFEAGELADWVSEHLPR